MPKDVQYCLRIKKSVQYKLQNTKEAKYLYL